MQKWLPLTPVYSSKKLVSVTHRVGNAARIAPTEGIPSPFVMDEIVAYQRAASGQTEAPIPVLQQVTTRTIQR